jgi:hypothetical protein
MALHKTNATARREITVTLREITVTLKDTGEAEY